MLVRSPRRFMLLFFVACVFLFAVLQQSPWAHSNVYEQLPPLFKSGNRRLNISEAVGLGSERLHQHLEDAWQYAIPAGTPSAGGKEKEAGGGDDAKSPVATPSVVDPQLVAGGAEAGAPVVPIDNSTPTKSYPPWITDPSRSTPIAPTMSRPANMKEYMKKMLKWSRPTWDGHWPPFGEYIDKEYDPNRWEQFSM
jgi:hypothetical protein